jgi:twinkle protein
LKIAEKLGEWKCKKAILPFKDANECLINGVPREEIQRCIDNARDFTPCDIVSPIHFLDKIQRLFAIGSGMFGVKTAWGSLDNLLKGWRDGELTIWSGRNGSGKSTILNQHLLNMADKGIKTCVYSGEMPPERYLRWAVIQHTENNAPPPSKIEASIKWMDGKVFILNFTSGIKPEYLFSMFEYAARRYDAKHFIIDSLMKISLGGEDDYGKQKEFIDNLTSFVKKHSVHVHLVAHPRKTVTDKDEPGKVDIKGSSHITDLADNVIVLYRTEQDIKEKTKAKGKSISDMQLYVKKNREFGIEGKIHMYFNEHTKKFSD